MTVTLNGVVVYGYEASCSCGWVGSWASVPSMAGFEFCPFCKKRYVGFITRAWVDRRPTRLAPDSLKAGAYCLPEFDKSENDLPAESG